MHTIRRLVHLAAVAVVLAAAVTACSSSKDPNAFCQASEQLASAGNRIQKLPIDDVAKVRARVATLVAPLHDAVAEAPSAVSNDVKLLATALEDFAAAVSHATTSQELITAFGAYKQRARDLADPSRKVAAWVDAHCRNLASDHSG